MHMIYDICVLLYLNHMYTIRLFWQITSDAVGHHIHENNQKTDILFCSNYKGTSTT